jgi:iron complex outermembrane receptor protein
MFGKPIDLSIDVNANRQLERSTLFIGDEGDRDFNEYQGEWGFPDWRANTFFRFEYDKLRLTYELRYMASVHQDAAGVDIFEDAITGLSDTCQGPPSDVLCRDYGDADNYFVHNLSLYYYGDRWTFGGGMRNLFDQAPPKVDGTEILAINNAPIGYGYDLQGRVYFFNVAVNFAGGQ